MSYEERLAKEIADEEKRVRAQGRPFGILDRMRVADGVPRGSLEGDDLRMLESKAEYYTWGLCLALLNGRKHKNLRRLVRGIQRVLKSGPLRAFGYRNLGYGAIDQVLTGLYQRTLPIEWSPRATEYTRSLHAYIRLTGYLWYQLRHLTNNPSYLSEALRDLEHHKNNLTQIGPCRG